MAENKNNLSINDDRSNAAMTHTSDAIASSDFIIRELDLNQEPEMQRESKNFWQDAWAQLKRNKLAVVGMIGLIIIVIFAFIGPVINKHDYAEQNVEHRNLPAKIPVLDKVPFLPFDGKDADGKDAYKAANAKENYWFGTRSVGSRFMDKNMERCSNFIVYRCCCSDVRYFYWRCIWCDFWILRWTCRYDYATYT